MLTFRCFKCGWPINLSRAELEAAVADAEGKGESHYTIECPQCRRINKVSVKQMRRKLPRDWHPQPAPAEPGAGDGSPEPGAESVD